MSQKIDLKRMLAEIAEDEANEPGKTELLSQDEIKAMLSRRDRGSIESKPGKTDSKQ